MSMTNIEVFKLLESHGHTKEALKALRYGVIRKGSKNIDDLVSKLLSEKESLEQNSRYFLLEEADGDRYKQIGEDYKPSANVEMHMTVDQVDDECLYADVFLKCSFSISGKERKEFSDKLGKLIDSYRKD